jgi:hypothetical protein
MIEENIYNEKDERIRFHKPERLIDKVNGNPLVCITEAFLIFHLEDICQEIDQWLEIALINNNSAYEEGEAREDLMDFCAEMQLLIEAFHVINEQNKSKDVDEWRNRLPNDLRGKIDQLDQPELLSPEQTANPILVINNFCNSFELSYARAELWDLLDAVIVYEGEREVYKMNLLLAYQWMSCLVEVAYVIYKRNDQADIKA